MTFLILLKLSFAFTQTKPLKKNLTFEAIYQTAYDYLDKENYREALKLFIKLDSIQSNIPNIQFHIGYCYFHIPVEKHKASTYLEKSTQSVVKKYSGKHYSFESPALAYFYYGKSLLINNNFDEALRAFNNFKNLLEPQHHKYLREVNFHIRKCELARNNMANPMKIKIENLGSNINTEYPEYAPTISIDEQRIYFTSRRPENTGAVIDNTGYYTEDIYFSEFNIENESWSVSSNKKLDINTLFNDATMNLSFDEKELIMYRDVRGNGTIFLSRKDNLNFWQKPVKLKYPINTLAWETHASLSADGKTLYFVSDRRGGYGGRDIYVSQRLENGKWSKPKNMGPSINTPYHEESPFITADGKMLFFSSQGHDNMGGFDVFMTILQPDGTWSKKPINMGYPINTTDDNVFFVPLKDGSIAYYAAIRPEGYGDQDIYRISSIDDSAKNLLSYLFCTLADPDHCMPPVDSIIASADSIPIIDADTIPVAVLPDTLKNNELAIVEQPIIPDKTVTEETPKNIDTEIIKPPDKLTEEKPKDVIITDKTQPTDITDKPITETIDNSTKNIETNHSKDNIKPETDKPIVNKDVTTEIKPIPVFDPVKNTIVEGTCYTVQVGAGYMDVKHFKKVGDDLRILDCPDGIRRYVTKEFSSKDEARAYKAEMVALGYKDAWVRECIQLKDLVAGDRVVLNNIFFDYAQATLRQESIVELEKLYQFLIANPSMKIEIAGHTDDVGPFWFNKKLSEQRAKVVFDYLIAKNIDRKRLIYKGYAYNFPLFSNNSEEGRAKNRRTEFKVINK